jgi:hypothetical protein
MRTVLSPREFAKWIDVSTAASRRSNTLDEGIKFISLHDTSRSDGRYGRQRYEASE